MIPIHMGGMMDEIKFTYELFAPGYARATLAIGQQKVEATASNAFFGDALREFLIMFAQVCERWTTRSRCTWDEEPGTFFWSLHLVDDENVEIRLTWLGEQESPPRRMRLLNATCHFRTLARAVIAGVDAMLEDVGGREKYAERCDFPSFKKRERDFPSKVHDVVRTFALGD
jgi:hypothetical protein